MPPRLLLERTFDVAAPPARVWAHLTTVERWPSWARHIRTARLDPPGALTAQSRGEFVLSNGIRTTFAVTEFTAGRSWKWRGPFLGLAIDYDHVLEPLPAGGTGVRFVIEAEGFAVGVLGTLFAAVYARNLDRAIPRLVAELGG